jgi:hypothetical protein
MNIYQKLNACRVALQSKPMKKSGENTFAKYKYFELGDFLPTINELFHEFGLCATTKFSAEHATLTIFDCDKPEDWVMFTSPMADAQLKGCHPIQNLGAVETYQRRYLYVMALEIVEHDALDASKPIDKEPAQRTKVTPTAGCFEGLGEAKRRQIEGIAEEVTSLATELDDVAAAWVIYDAVKDAEERAALRSLLDSKVKSALRKYGEAAHSTIQEMASQA